MQKSKILVTGASGLLGANTLVELKKLGYDVCGFYQSHKITVPGTQTLQVNLTDTKTTLKVLKELKPEYIIHTAAATNVDACEKDHTLADQLNVGATETLAQYCTQSKTKLIHISTDAFFDGPPGKLFVEDDEPMPMSYYAETKWQAEETVRALAPDSLIIRTNIYGWNFQNKQSLSEWMLSSLREKKQTTLFKDVFYTPILTHTLIEAIMKLIQLKAQGVFHVTSDRSISKLEFGRLICKMFQLDSQYIVESSVIDKKFSAARSNNMSLSNAKLKACVKGLDLTVEKDLMRFKELEDSGFAKELKAFTARES